jgi:hypothetical protein
MQINNNYQASPNFGRLMIDKKAAKNLRTLPEETINTIKKAGELLKDTKYYHAKINENLEARLVSENNPYFGLFTNDKYTTQFGEETVNGKKIQTNKIIIADDKIGNLDFGVAKYGDTYNVWGAFGAYNRAGEIGEIARAAKVLDDVAIRKAAEAEEKQAILAKIQEKVNKEVDNLIDNFGV